MRLHQYLPWVTKLWRAWEAIEIEICSSFPEICREFFVVLRSVLLMEEIRLTTWYVVHPIICRVFTSYRWCRIYSTNCMVTQKACEDLKPGKTWHVILNSFVFRLGLLWSLPLDRKVMKNMSNNSQWNMTMRSCPLWKIRLYPLHMVEIEPKGHIFWLLVLPHSLYVTSRWDILKQSETEASERLLLSCFIWFDTTWSHRDVRWSSLSVPGLNSATN